MKLAPSEAAKLARFMERNCKPITEADQAEMLHWLKRLEGTKS